MMRTLKITGTSSTMAVVGYRYATSADQVTALLASMVSGGGDHDHVDRRAS